jgi:hypothetical protein
MGAYRGTPRLRKPPHVTSPNLSGFGTSPLGPPAAAMETLALQKVWLDAAQERLVAATGNTQTGS